MQPEIKEAGGSPTEPLILLSANDFFAEKDRETSFKTHFRQDEDLIQGWYCKVTLDPCLQGAPLSTAGSWAGGLGY